VLNLLAAINEKWRERRLVRAAKLLEELKVRYHTFRIVLANNEYALDLMRSVDQGLRSGSPLTDLSEVTEELLSVTYELVDGLNRLSEGGHQRLFEIHLNLAHAIREELETLTAAGQALGPSCISLDDLTADCRDRVGGKAAALARLRQAGFPVPAGFAVTADACMIFLSGRRPGSLRPGITGAPTLRPMPKRFAAVLSAAACPKILKTS
jgi:pyruvate,water dikinase